MAYLQHTNISTNALLKKLAISGVGVSALPLSLPRVRTIVSLAGERALSQRLYSKELNFFPKRRSYSTIPKKVTFPIPRSGPSNSGGNKDEPSDDAKDNSFHGPILRKPEQEIYKPEKAQPKSSSESQTTEMLN